MKTKSISDIKNLIKFINNFEPLYNETGYNFRVKIIYPLINILFQDSIRKKKLFKKKLNNNFSVFYDLSSRITKDFFISKSVKPDHVNEPQTTKLLTKILQKNKNKNIILGGAFIGDMTIPLAYYNRKSNKKTIHCFEVDDGPYKILKKNININKLQCIKLNKYALHNKDNISLYANVNESSLTSLQSKKTKTNIKYKTTTIDRYCLLQNINMVSVIHLDIEGNELNALKGARNLLKQDKFNSPDIIFEYCNYFNLQTKKSFTFSINKSKIILFLKKYGYSFYAIRDFSSNIGKTLKNVEIIPINQVFHKNLPYCFNIYCTKNEDNILTYNLKVCRKVNPKLLYHENRKKHWPIHV